MFDGLIDGYTQSILIFSGISVIAAYSFFAPFKTGQVSLGQAGFMAVGAYASAVLTQKFGLPFAAALPVAGLIAGVVGVVVGFPALRIKGIYLLLLMVSLWFFIERTRIGRAIRATAENHETAALLGVDVNKVVLVTFMIGSGIAGIAGVLDGVKNSGISPFMGVAVAVKGLIVMLLGGLGNVPGAMVAGLMLGMIEILSAAYIGTTERDLFSFLILILILLFRPTGLFGTRTAEQR